MMKKKELIQFLLDCGFLTDMDMFNHLAKHHNKVRDEFDDDFRKGIDVIKKELVDKGWI